MDHFLEHPKVQYIPLSIKNLNMGAWQNPFHNYNNPDIYFFQNQEGLSSKLSHYKLPDIELAPEEFDHCIAVLALNFKIEKGYFRFLTAKYIGEKKEGHFQVFCVTKKYFPKRVLHFALFTEEGKKISWENVEII